MSLFGLEEATKVFLYARPADMRKGFDGLIKEGQFKDLTLTYDFEAEVAEIKRTASV